MKKLFYAIAITPFLFSCAMNHASKEKVVKINQTIPNNSVEIKVGESVKIEAESNPSTGYNWNIQVPAGCTVEFVKEDSRSIYKDNRVGAPLIAVYEFKAIEAGECEVEFDYSRAWEGKSNNPVKVKFVVH